MFQLIRGQDWGSALVSFHVTSNKQMGTVRWPVLVREHSAVNNSDVILLGHQVIAGHMLFTK